MKLLIGADPEIFIFDNKLGKVISAHGLFPGTKEEPYKVEHGAIQVDGMAAEYNILPASNYVEFVFYNLSVLRSLRDKIAELNPDLDFKFVFDPVAEFGAEYIAEQPEEARRLGCTPDYNAYEGGAPNPTPDADMPFRTASGHLHFGWTNDQDIEDPEFIEACCMMTKQLDYYLGSMSVKMENHLKVDGKKRRELYGKAGAFRPKSYGVEYRTSSNVWLYSTPWMEQMFNYGATSFRDLLGGYRYYEEFGDGGGMRHWIDNFEVGNLKYYGVSPGYTNAGRVTMETLDSLFEVYKIKLEGMEAIPEFHHFDEEDNFEVEREEEHDEWEDDDDDFDLDFEDPQPVIELPRADRDPWQPVKHGVAAGPLQAVFHGDNLIVDIEVADVPQR